MATLTPTSLVPSNSYFDAPQWVEFYRTTAPKATPLPGELTHGAFITCPFYQGKRVYETHFAFLGFEAITIPKLQELNPKTSQPRFANYAPDCWYPEESFATKDALKSR